MKALNLLVSPLTLLITRVAGFLSENEITSDVTDSRTEKTGLNPIVLTVWTGEEGTDWHNAANWTNGLPTEGKHAYIPTYPKGDQFPVITEECMIDFTIKNDGMIKNNGELTIMPNGLFQNYGILENKIDSKLINKGNCFNAGAIINTGYMAVSYTHLRAHETSLHLVCRLLLEKAVSVWKKMRPSNGKPAGFFQRQILAFSWPGTKWVPRNDGSGVA